MFLRKANPGFFFSAAVLALLFLPSIVYAQSRCPILETLRVQGGSMSPRLATGARLVLYDVACAGPIKAGDLVVFTGGAAPIPLIKAVKAVPGDRFSLRPVTTAAAEDDEKGKQKLSLFVNGAAAVNSAGRPYLYTEKQASMLRLTEESYGGVVPENAYLVLGDRVGGTLDSARYGLVAGKDIRGIAVPLPVTDQRKPPL